MMRGLGALAGRWLRAAFRPPFGNRGLAAVAVMVLTSIAVLDVAYEAARALLWAALVVSVLALVWGLLNLAKPGLFPDPAQKKDDARCP